MTGTSTDDETGSPPRGRGKAQEWMKEGKAERITPAWAGKSAPHGFLAQVDGDHPRVGGEKLLFVVSRNLRLGSPPRGRGKVSVGAALKNPVRITPAWAGKSAAYFRAEWVPKDHPRVGGEKIWLRFDRLFLLGSPPRGRGKGRIFPRGVSAQGITPAWAGKSHPATPTTSGGRDHPRVGGEKRGLKVRRQAGGGSPPRGRGKGQTVPQVITLTGITPAWAGKRLKRSHRSGIFISRPIPFHSVLHRPAGSGGSRTGRDGSPAGQPQNAGPA